MNETVVLAVISLFGGAVGAKAIDLWGQRQRMAFEERASVRDIDGHRVEVLEQRVDALRTEVSTWQAKYLEAAVHVQRCEADLREIRQRLDELEKKA